MNLINRTKAKQFALQLAAHQRAHKFTRVSPSFLERLEGRLRQMVAEEINRLPSVGQTLR